MELLEILDRMDPLRRYTVDRLREHSRILEPDQKIDPYRRWSSPINDLDRELTALVDVNDHKEVIARVHRLLSDLSREAINAEPRARILQSALDLVSRINEDFACEILDQAIPAYDALPQPEDLGTLMDRMRFLETALSAAARVERVDFAHPLVNRFQALLQAQQRDLVIQALGRLTGQYFRGLRELDMQDELDHTLTLVGNVLLPGQDLNNIDASQLPTNPESLRILLKVASHWLDFGRYHQIEPVLAAVCSLLFRDQLHGKEKTALACVYATTVGRTPLEAAQKRLEEIFLKLDGISEIYTTNDYFSLAHLDVIEAVVLAGGDCGIAPIIRSGES
jgi:cellulose synthase operon protein C